MQEEKRAEPIKPTPPQPLFLGSEELTGFFNEACTELEEDGVGKDLLSLCQSFCRIGRSISSSSVEILGTINASLTSLD